MSFVEKRNHFYFWVKRIIPQGFGAKSVLDGFDFEGGPSARTTWYPDEEYWLLTPKEKRRLSEKIDFIHMCNQGWFVVSDFSIDSVPFLVTSDPRIKCIFCRDINVSSNDPSIDISWLVGDGIPLVGHDWFGILLKSGLNSQLLAFSDCDRLELPNEACYPEWESTFRLYLS